MFQRNLREVGRTGAGGEVIFDYNERGEGGYFLQKMAAWDKIKEASLFMFALLK